jgi:hypothetical protein
MLGIHGKCCKCGQLGVLLWVRTGSKPNTGLCGSCLRIVYGKADARPHEYSGCGIGRVLLRLKGQRKPPQRDLPEKCSTCQ